MSEYRVAQDVALGVEMKLLDAGYAVVALVRVDRAAVVDDIVLYSGNPTVINDTPIEFSDVQAKMVTNKLNVKPLYLQQDALKEQLVISH